MLSFDVCNIGVAIPDFSVVLKRLGFLDFPINVNLSLWLPVALLQAKMVTRSLLFLYPGAAASFIDASVFVESIL